MSYPPPPSVTPQSESPPILLVDDNPTNLQVLYQTLENIGHRLLIAKSGEQALMISRRAKPILVLLDIMMPGLDGYETCRQLKDDRETADVAVIFLSALNDAADKVRGLELGAVDFIAKPFNADEVIARVKTHLRIRMLEQSLADKNRALESANQRMTDDLQAAAQVQKALLPSEPLQVDGVDSAWRCLPCKELAGDTLNVFALGEKRLGMYMIDVSGHGVSSSLLAFTIAHELTPKYGSDGLLLSGREYRCPAEIATELNHRYPMSAANRQFFTLLYAVLELDSGLLHYVCAGHPGPILIHRDSSGEHLHTPAVPIGLLPESVYQVQHKQLQPGDRLFMVSDGLTEERNIDGEQLGIERLQDTLAANLEYGLEDCLDKLIEQGRQWHGQQTFRDDVTALAVTWQENPDDQ